jgi:hypothetical protein
MATGTSRWICIKARPITSGRLRVTLPAIAAVNILVFTVLSLVPETSAFLRDDRDVALAAL